MESKRQSQEEGDERDVQSLSHASKRRREDSQQSQSCSTIGNFRFPLHLMHDIQPYMTDLVRRLVREEFENRVIPRLNNQIGISEPKLFKLVFKNELPATYSTFSKIKAKDESCIEIGLYDIRSGCAVTDGPLSSMKIGICVLNGEFGLNGSEDRSTDEFNKAKILSRRDNDGKLLKGDTVFRLREGVGYVNNIEFTENSKRTRTGKYLLGVWAVKSTNIREGLSERFVVKDRRGDQKHYPPFLHDETWRLEGISKNGACKRLSSHGINTVQDLLKLHETNPSSLKKIFGKTSTKQLEAIIKHAKTSVADRTFTGVNYHSQNTLYSNDKQTYENSNTMVPIETTTHDIGKTLTVQTAQYSAPNQDLQQFDFPIAQLEEEIPWQGLLQNMSPASQFFPEEHIDDGNGWPFNVQYDQIASFSTPNRSEQLNPVFFPNGDHEAGCSNHFSFLNSAVYTSSKGKSKKVWQKIRSAFKWVTLHVATKKGKLFCHHN